VGLGDGERICDVMGIISFISFLNGNGMVACNPRDREAAYRATVKGIATENEKAVTCKKCRVAMRRARA